MDSRFDLLWARFTRASAFLIGSGIMVYETTADKSDRPWLYAAALGMMGLPVARAAEGVLARLGSSGPGTGGETLPEQKAKEKS